MNILNAAAVVMTTGVLLLAAGETLASPISLVLTGTIESADVGGPLPVGSSFTATVNIDSSTAGVADAEPGVIDYDHLGPAFGVVLETDAGDFATSTATILENGGVSLSVRVVNDLDDGFGGASDNVRIRSLVEPQPQGTPAVFSTLLLSFGDATATALLDSLLSDVPWDLAPYSSGAALLLGNGTDRSVGTVTSLHVIPEPTTGLLVTLSLAGLAAHDRGGERKKRSYF